MAIRFAKALAFLVTVALGLLFVSNIYVLGDTQAAVGMHDDLPRTAGALAANAKVILCFVVGLLYLTAAVGIARKRPNWAIAGVAGFVLFDGFYLLELALWSRIHPRIWFDFSVFGGLSLVIGVYCGRAWRQRARPSRPSVLPQ